MTRIGVWGVTASVEEDAIIPHPYTLHPTPNKGFPRNKLSQIVGWAGQPALNMGRVGTLRSLPERTSSRQLLSIPQENLGCFLFGSP